MTTSPFCTTSLRLKQQSLNFKSPTQKTKIIYFKNPISENRNSNFVTAMDSMVSTTMAIEREIDDAWSIRDAGASEKRKEGEG